MGNVRYTVIHNTALDRVQRFVRIRETTHATPLTTPLEHYHEADA